MAFLRKIRASKRSALKSASLSVVSELTIPEYFRCPISLDLMKDPVTAPTGITYDRQSIEKWLDMGNSTCPITKMIIGSNDLVPNHTVRRMIQHWCVENQSRGVERIPTPRIPVGVAEAIEILSNVSFASKHGDGELCLDLVRRVKSSVKDSERNRRCYLSIGAPVILASAFKAFKIESIATLEEILAALAGLFPFHDETTMSELGYQDSLDSILHIMKHGSINNKINALSIAKSMASSSEKLAKAMSKRNGFIEAVVDFIIKPISAHVTKAALAIAFRLISDDEMISEKCVKSGLVSSLLEILIDSDKSTTEKALIVLDALCNYEIGKEECCQHALTIPTLSKKMFRVSDATTETTISTLLKLCKSCKRSSCLEECLQVGLFQKLLLMLQVGCSKLVKEKVTEMLKMMSSINEKMECIDTGDFKGLNKLS